MGRYIIKLIDPETQKEFYLEWSTIVDAPVTYGMTLEEFKQYYLEEYGRSSMDALEFRLARVNNYGTSSVKGKSLKEMIIGNRAGPNEETLTMEGILDTYCLNLPTKDEWIVPQRMMMSQHKHEWTHTRIFSGDGDYAYVIFCLCGEVWSPEGIIDEFTKVDELEDKLVKIKDCIDQIDEYNQPPVDTLCWIIDCILKGIPYEST